MPENFRFNDLGASELDKAALDKLQCNILCSTGRPQSKQIFHRFGDAKKLAAWLFAQQVPPPSTENETAPEVVTLLFSKEALVLLGVEAAILDHMDPAFLRGARHVDTIKKLPDTKPDSWGEHEQPWHVAELRGHDFMQPFQAPTGDDYVMEHGAGLDPDGNELKERRQPSHGHFGILDGISKLVYTPADYAALRNKPPEGQPWKFDPRQKLSTLLVRDPLTPSADAFGSYFVFRKYEQDRAVFDKRLDAIAAAVAERRLVHDIVGKISPDVVFPTLEGKTGAALKEELIRLIFGRASNGNTPAGNTSNDFNFENAPESSCPFHAHISKMNPRGRTGDPEERSRAIARRGTSYVRTTVKKNGAETTKNAAGLLFWSAQASIANQFEYIMEKWANSSNSGSENEPTPDIDPVVGQLTSELKFATVWRNWKATTHLDCNVWEAVRFVASEYLYAPSLDGIRALRARAEGILAKGV